MVVAALEKPVKRKPVRKRPSQKIAEANAHADAHADANGIEGQQQQEQQEPELESGDVLRELESRVGRKKVKGNKGSDKPSKRAKRPNIGSDADFIGLARMNEESFKASTEAIVNVF